jgi:hypothetical protein
MGIYIFPIFLFGCVVTGIVFLGVQQAADWAKQEAARNSETDRDRENSATRETGIDNKLKTN